MDEKALAQSVEEGIALARSLGDRQNRDTTLTGDHATRIVNCLLNLCNPLEFYFRNKNKETPCQTPPT